MKKNVKTTFWTGLVGSLSILMTAHLHSHSADSSKHGVAIHNEVTKEAIGLCNTHGGVLCVSASDG